MTKFTQGAIIRSNPDGGKVPHTITSHLASHVPSGGAVTDVIFGQIQFNPDGTMLETKADGAYPF